MWDVLWASFKIRFYSQSVGPSICLMTPDPSSPIFCRVSLFLGMVSWIEVGWSVSRYRLWAVGLGNTCAYWFLWTRLETISMMRRSWPSYGRSDIFHRDALLISVLIWLYSMCCTSWMCSVCESWSSSSDTSILCRLMGTCWWLTYW